MAITVQNHHVEQFKGNVTHLAQQMQSRLRGTVTTEMVTGALHNFRAYGCYRRSRENFSKCRNP